MPPTKRAARQIPRQDDDDEQEAEAPTPAPRKISSAGPPAAAADDDDDDDEGGEKPTLQVRRGMSAARQVIDSTSSFAQAFKLTEQIQVIKFLEDDAYASYTRHWIERMTPTGRANRSYNCLKNWKKGGVPMACPLCEVGDKPQAVVAFNIALIGDDGVATLKTFDCGPKLYGIVENYARDPKVAPLSKGYFLASRSGKQGTVNYQLVPIKAHSLTDDYDIDPPSDVELKALGLYDMEGVLTMPKTKDLEGIAAEIADEY
jgi:hypothetical protein